MALGKTLDNNAFNSAGFLFSYNHTTMNVGCVQHNQAMPTKLIQWVANGRTFSNRLFKLGKDGVRHNKTFRPDLFFISCKQVRGWACAQHSIHTVSSSRTPQGLNLNRNPLSGALKLVHLFTRLSQVCAGNSVHSVFWCSHAGTAEPTAEEAL